MDEPEELLALARDLAGQAAVLTLERLATPRSDVRTKSTGTDMVTEVDEASERLIVGAIRAARPGDGILSEEGSASENESGVRWVIDPIDGTTNYLYGHPGYAISIAVERDGETLCGVVHDPLHREVFTAIAGRGAFRNDEAIEVSGQDELGHALVATGFGYDPARRRSQAKVIGEVIGEVRDIRRMGAAAVDLCSVACGRVDAYFERGLRRWDLAAGELIAREAGATVGEIGGDAPGETSAIAAPPAIYEELRELVLRAGAAEHV